MEGYLPSTSPGLATIVNVGFAVRGQECRSRMATTAARH